MTGTDYAGFLAMVSTVLAVTVVLPSIVLGWLLRGLWHARRHRTVVFNAYRAGVADRDRPNPIDSAGA